MHSQGLGWCPTGSCATKGQQCAERRQRFSTVRQWNKGEMQGSQRSSRFEEGCAQRDEVLPPLTAALFWLLTVSRVSIRSWVISGGTCFPRQILHGPLNQDGFMRPIPRHQSSCIMHFL